MLALAAIAVLQAGAPAAVAPQQTFCERMAEVWNMGSRPNKKGTPGRTFFAFLKSRSPTQMSFRTDAQASDSARETCAAAEFGGTCDIVGPGVLTIRTARFTRQFPAYAGETATFDTNTRLVNCIEPGVKRDSVDATALKP